METRKTVLSTQQIKFELVDAQGPLARASGVLVRNDLHPEPYMLIEDVYVRPEERGKGLGVTVVNHCITEARLRGCYKVILCAQRDERDLPGWYASRFGFRPTTEVEMRIDLM